ncbi:MBL fold metallo-hydrolase [Agrobacterium sp. a22-2]|uniref:MBL fold metallo-hydrolase n=1 Tax=Agrobacterium sp. a22-2 TaxID=2283840 RepID=UPI0014460104|nr:MBL fold metallo-hydrolase [Agrobacterium sp. a22-2]NKN37533.1 MBL fold metallo-hydrolase [Agrobacterium sp. a22-2]
MAGDPVNEIPAQSARLTVTVWGARGSVPVSGPVFSRYGGNTTCIEVRCGKDVMIFDAGTGIVPAGRKLLQEEETELNLFLTHCHFDHIIGLPFFAPLHKPHMSVNIASAHMEGRMTTRAIVEAIMQPPWFPVGPEVFKAAVTYQDFMPGDMLEPKPGVVLRTDRLRHPGGAVGYRIEFAGKVVAIITDTEHVPGELDEHVLALVDGADLLLYDSAYCDDEMRKYNGFGHSSWQQAIRLGEAAGVQTIGMIHHSFFHEDEDLDRIARQAKARFDRSFVISDGQVFEF